MIYLRLKCMKLVLQRVLSSSVDVGLETINSIGKGYLILLGIEKDDSEDDCEILSSKILGLRIFEDNSGKMNLSINDVEGEILVVSNFTICANCKNGRRPSFSLAEKPSKAYLLYEKFCEHLEQIGANKIKKGMFGANMRVNIVNYGPVTIVLDSKELKNKC